MNLKIIFLLLHTFFYTVEENNTNCYFYGEKLGIEDYSLGMTFDYFCSKNKHFEIVIEKEKEKRIIFTKENSFINREVNYTLDFENGILIRTTFLFKIKDAKDFKQHINVLKLDSKNQIFLEKERYNYIKKSKNCKVFIRYYTLGDDYFFLGGISGHNSD